MSEEKKMKRYLVTVDIFCTETYEVEAVNEDDAFVLAQEQVNLGMGEEVTLFEVEELEDEEV